MQKFKKDGATSEEGETRKNGSSETRVLFLVTLFVTLAKLPNYHIIYDRM